MSIVVSRTVIDAVSGLSEVQKRTDEKLSALIDTVRKPEGKIDARIDTVDRIIRRDNGHKGSEH